jgi:2-polyprenyl-6-methoxyphenol hydroxylase-like FAD-dependent oxidoreductase
MNTTVIIIGAGPTGLMAACQLARFGVDMIIIDAKAGINVESRAMLVTARSMEIYQQMGLSDKVVAGGKYIEDFTIFMEGKEKLRFSMGSTGNGLTDFPYLQSFEQSRNESLLYEHLKSSQHDVLWNTEFLSLERSTESVNVRLQDLTSQQFLHIQAKYLIGCDGASSKVRQQLNCKFEGGTYENKFFVADTKIEWGQPVHQLIAAPTKTNFCAFFPMYEDGSYRILGTLPKSFKDREDIDFKALETVIKDTIGVPLEFKTVNWFSVYKLHHRCVETFSVDRCFLAGDAAHVHSPAGGQGMNTGLQDAYNLSWKLWMVLSGHGGKKLLDTYHAERYPFAKWLLKFTDRIFGFMTSNNTLIYQLRRYLMPAIFKMVSFSPRLKKGIFTTLSQIWYSYKHGPLSAQHTARSLKFRAGDRFPYILIENDGKMQSCYHLLTGPNFHLLCIGTDAKLKQASIPPALMPLIKIVELPLSLDWLKLGVSEQIYILVRPDNYIGLVSDQMHEGTLSDYFRRYQ